MNRHRPDNNISHHTFLLWPKFRTLKAILGLILLGVIIVVILINVAVSRNNNFQLSINKKNVIKLTLLQNNGANKTLITTTKQRNKINPIHVIPEEFKYFDNTDKPLDISRMDVLRYHMISKNNHSSPAKRTWEFRSMRNKTLTLSLLQNKPSIEIRFRSNKTATTPYSKNIAPNLVIPKEPKSFAKAIKSLNLSGMEMFKSHVISKINRTSLIKQNQELKYGINISTADSKSTIMPKFKLKYSSIRIVDKFKISCKNILSNNKKELNKAEEVMKNIISESKSDLQFSNLTKNCKTFLKARKYPTKPLTVEEKEFPLAFSIMVHKDASQVDRLLQAIYWPQNYYCIHVDKKSSYDLWLAMQSLSKCFNNVFVSSKLEQIFYPDISIVQADLNCMKDLLLKSSKWKYFINLSGQEFPLRTNRELVKIFTIFNGTNDIQARYWPKITNLRTQYSYKLKFENKTKMYKLFKTSKKKSAPPHHLTIYKGSRYGAFSRSFIHFILTNKISTDLFNWLKDTTNPDESYWGTLVANAHIKAPGGWNGTRNHLVSKFVIWNTKYKNGRRTHHCKSNYFVRSVCIYGIRDLHQLSQRPHFFANKFYQNFQPIALECMEELINNRTFGLTPSNLNISSYRIISSKKLYKDSILNPIFG